MKKKTDEETIESPKKGDVVGTEDTPSEQLKGAASMVDDMALDTTDDGNVIVVAKKPTTKQIPKLERSDVGDQDIVNLKAAAKVRSDQAKQIEDLQMGDEIDRLVTKLGQDETGPVSVGHVPLDDRSIPHRASIDDPIRDLNNNLVDVNNDRLEQFHQIDGDKLLHDRGQLGQQDAMDIITVLRTAEQTTGEADKKIPKEVSDEEVAPKPKPTVPDKTQADSEHDKLRAENRVLADKLDAERQKNKESTG